MSIHFEILFLLRYSLSVFKTAHHIKLKTKQFVWKVWNCYLWWFFLSSFFSLSLSLSLSLPRSICLVSSHLCEYIARPFNFDSNSCVNWRKRDRGAVSLLMLLLFLMYFILCNSHSSPDHICFICESSIEYNNLPFCYIFFSLHNRQLFFFFLVFFSCFCCCSSN